MIEMDNAVIAALIQVGLAFSLPFVASFMIDNYDKKTPPVKG